MQGVLTTAVGFHRVHRPVRRRGDDHIPWHRRSRHGARAPACLARRAPRARLPGPARPSQHARSPRAPAASRCPSPSASRSRRRPRRSSRSSRWRRRFPPPRRGGGLGIFACLLTARRFSSTATFIPSPSCCFRPRRRWRRRKTTRPFELVPGDVNETAKVQKPWGEVRIVTPGRDVKLTKIDVLPLQIEMAASAQLQNPAWITSINGGPEERHELPRRRASRNTPSTSP